MSPMLTPDAANRYQRVFQGGYDNAAQHWKKGLVALLAGLVIWSGIELVFGEHGLLKQKELEAERARLESENAVLAGNVSRMAEENHRMATDDFMGEKMAREMLKRAKPGEVIYFFEENPAAGSSLPMTYKDVRVVTRPPKRDEADAARP
jgi:cell division protein FtsB